MKEGFIKMKTLTERLTELANRLDTLDNLYMELEEGSEDEDSLGLSLGLIEAIINDLEEKIDEAEKEFNIKN